MKKNYLITLILALAVAFTLSSCGDKIETPTPEKPIEPEIVYQELTIFMPKNLTIGSITTISDEKNDEILKVETAADEHDKVIIKIKYGEITEKIKYNEITEEIKYGKLKSEKKTYIYYTCKIPQESSLKITYEKNKNHSYKCRFCYADMTFDELSNDDQQTLQRFVRYEISGSIAPMPSESPAVLDIEVAEADCVVYINLWVD